MTVARGDKKSCDHICLEVEELGYSLSFSKALQNSPGCIELDKGVSLGDRGGKRGGREDMKSCFNHSLNRMV